MWVLREAGRREDQGLTLRLLPGGNRTIGRSAVADFIVGRPLVSRVHCRLEVRPTGELEVQDLDSTNGTFVNDQRVDRAVLVAGDRLRIGRLELEVRWAPDPTGG